MLLEDLEYENEVLRQKVIDLEHKIIEMQNLIDTYEWVIGVGDA